MNSPLAAAMPRFRAAPCPCRSAVLGAPSSVNSFPPGEPFTSKLEGPLLLNEELLVNPPVITMPGASCTSVIGLPSDRGSSAIRLRSITCPDVAVLTSSSGASAVTLTLSCTAPTAS